jgi:hypothetical protein
MKVKTVKQYKCDFCGKKNYQAGAMKSHEKHCTMNPERSCRMCDKTGGHGFDVSELLAMLPSPAESIANINEINEAIKKLQVKVEHCPACVLAAIRQKKIPVGATSFNFKKELDNFWADYNDAHSDEGVYYV